MSEIISVIVPIYNVEKELPRCIDSIIRQTYPYLEIILVNDGSVDNSAIICQKYAKEDVRIILINKKNGGLSDARNVGLRKAHGQYIMYVDSDDYLELNACEKLLEGIQNEQVDFVVGAIKEIRNQSISFQRHKNVEPYKIYSAKDFMIASIRKNEWFAPAVLNLYRRDFLIDNELYFRVGQYYEDMEMLPRLYLAARRITYVDCVFYNYVIRDNSITTSSSNLKKVNDIQNNYIQWKKRFDEVKDAELQKSLYGFLLKCCLKSCRDHKIKKWLIPGCDMKFIARYSLNKKEFLKGLMFNFFPQIYTRI